MIRKVRPAVDEAAERASIRRTVKRLYAWFNQGLWEKCWFLLDPKLRKPAKVELSPYAASLAAFHKSYGAIHPWYIRINLHLEASNNKHDDRPFAYVYVIWQDQDHEFHMFRERWIKDSEQWFSRVVGLVPNRKTSPTIVDD